jgi:hypothetical protein
MASISYEQPPQLFRRIRPEGGDRFVEVSDSAGEDFMRPLVARGLAVADYDRDGDPDLVVTQCGGPAVLFRNDRAEPAGWLVIKVRQPGMNPDAIGAVVTVEAGGNTRRVTVRTGGSYCSQNALAIPFGLGPKQVDARVTVRWPDGAEDAYKRVPGGQHVLITRGKGVRPLPSE